MSLAYDRSAARRLSTGTPGGSHALLNAMALLGMVDLAIAGGLWTVDGACDPDALVFTLRDALDQRDGARCAEFSSRLAGVALSAIESGDWKAPADANIAFLRGLAVAEDGYHPDELAA